VILPIPKDGNGTAYLANVDSGGNLAVPIEQWIKSGGLYVPVSAAAPLPTSMLTAIPAGSSTIGGVTNPNIEQTPGSAVPAKVVALGASDGTNLQALKVVSAAYPNLMVSIYDAAGSNAKVLVTPPSSDGTAGTSSLFTAALGYACNGASWDRLRYANIDKAANPVASGDNAIWTPTSGKKFRLLGGFLLASGGANTCQFKDSSTAFGPSIPLTANQLLPLDSIFARSNGKLSAAANNVLNLNLSAATAVAVWLVGTEE
jgi:hypothetical protein